MFFEVLLFCFLGLVSAAVSGILGTSGGLIIVPGLTLIFNHLLFPQLENFPLIMGTSLICMMFNSFLTMFYRISAFKHVKELCYFFLIGAGLGAIVGPLISLSLPYVLLKRLLGLLLCGISISLVFMKKEEKGEEKSLKPFFTNSTTALLSSLSTMFGIGGGVFYTNFFLRLNISLKKAIRISSTITFFTTFIALIVFFFSSSPQTRYAYTYHNIYLPAFFPIMIISMIVNPIITKYTHQGTIIPIQKIFLILLFFAGITIFL